MLDSDDVEAEQSDVEPIVAIDLSNDLPGAVLMVPNAHWGFKSVSSEDHPGACMYYEEAERRGTLLKGTDAENIRNSRGYTFVEPSSGNGLQKRTAFELVPRSFRSHRLLLYFPERRLGKIDQLTLACLRAELARLHPLE